LSVGQALLHILCEFATLRALLPRHLFGLGFRLGSALLPGSRAQKAEERGAFLKQCLRAGELTRGLSALKRVDGKRERSFGFGHRRRKYCGTMELEGALALDHRVFFRGLYCAYGLLAGRISCFCKGGKALLVRLKRLLPRLPLNALLRVLHARHALR